MQNKKTIDSIDFSNKRIKRRSSTRFRENVKRWFEYEHELCDWILNLWLYSKNMSDGIIEMYALVNLELIKDYWDHHTYINCEFIIDHLLRNDSSFFDFEVFLQPKNFCLSKLMIYSLITKPNKRPFAIRADKKIQPV